MTFEDYLFSGIIVAFICFGIWVFTPHGRRTIAAAANAERETSKINLETEKMQHEQHQLLERERMELNAILERERMELNGIAERERMALAAEKERIRLELEAERARLEAELGVSLKKEPEVVYIEKEVPVMVGEDLSEIEPQPAQSTGSGVGKAVVKAGIAGAAGYAFGRKFL